MQLVENTTLFKKYVLVSSVGMTHEILYYPTRKFVCYWLTPASGIGSYIKFFTKKDILKEANKLGYLNNVEKEKVKSLLLSIADHFE